MYNIVTKKTEDPTEEFSGIWVNTQSGSIWLWADAPILLGHTGDGRMVRGDVFHADFMYEEKRNRQVYKYEFEYKGFPLLVVADVTTNAFLGTDAVISFGEEYGRVSEDGKFILAQYGNVRLGEKITIECTPEIGSMHVDLIVLTYE